MDRMVSVTLVPGNPVMILTAPSVLSPLALLPLMRVMMSPGLTPAREAGVSGSGMTTTMLLRIVRLDPNSNAAELPFRGLFQVLQIVGPDDVGEEIELGKRPFGEFADENFLGNLHRLLIHVAKVHKGLGDDVGTRVGRGQFGLGFPILDVVEKYFC